ncbi:hypothetical protein MNR01_08605 [Lysobacter sp. S4-A87]|uniref:hypothetical protein n=1 Tax=Lysobacter sp. S4-A87 TaxID=2925843 RepID=UPI001F53DB5D|nr:hypothetical protein [Lysobacter sp. S4-A87]UNK51034.1 hypothetical protein MNR01_08605 [Lysobacter sp. S4-A87]
MRINPIVPVLSLVIAALVGTAILGVPQVVAQGAPAAGTSAVTIDARPFPRDFTVQGTSFSVHQPQYDSWEGNQLKGRFVMAVKSGVHTGKDGKSEASFDYGVVQFQARTEIDKEARAVVLTDLQLPSASFPTATAKQAQYLELARQQLKTKSTLTVSLDMLESALAIAKVDARLPPSLPVKNDPPDIIFSTTPAVLLLVDGEPALKPSGVSGVQRVINTRSLLLQQGGKYYTNVAGHWSTAPALAGPWTATANVDAALTQAMAKAGKDVDTFDNPPDALKQDFASGRAPGIYVRTHPSELISVQGDPQFVAIPGTKLSYVDNTGADVLLDGSADNAWYVLVSGRWFTAATAKGPWRHVPPSSLPAEFAKIPPDSPKSGVLASIPNTPESREALIANDIPQNATVKRNEAKLNVQYDGAPQFVSIGGTTLQYAHNTAVPVIKVAANSFYAVDKGIWFSASAATGPWAVATSVPPEIYSIPTSSPLHYVTYVRVYGSSDDEVYVGYTPGYYGTVVTDNVVVYGTGYACDPWVGAYWYGCPATYGMGVYFGWNAWVGWTFGYGWGWYGGWYGPYSPWWGPWYGPGYGWGYWGGGAAAWNVYGHWGNAAVRGTAAAWADPWTGNVGRGGRGGYYNEATGGRGVGRAGVNTNIYTGTTTAGAQGIRYNPQTGRVVAGGGAVAVNPYTGQAAAGGSRTTVNTNTGRVTQSAGGAVAGPNGAAGVGGFDSQGNRVDAKGVGGFHYNADTGSLSHGGVVNVNDNVYAGKDGNVYKHDENGWSQVTRPDASKNLSGQTRDLDGERMARDRGNERITGGSYGGRPSNMGSGGNYNRPAGGYNRPAGGYNRPAGGYNRPVGGFRPSMGGGRGGGGFRRR